MFEIGLDISSNKISAVECYKTNRDVFIKNAGMIDIEPHAITNAELVDSIVLTEGLKNLWKNFKFQKKEVNLGISSIKLVIKEIELPLTEEKEIENALKYQVEDYFPIAKANLVFDYYIIEKKAESSKIMIIGAFKNMIDNYIEAVQSAGLTINSIDLNCFAFYRAANFVNNFKNLRLAELGKSFCLVYFGQDVSIIEFADENELRYPRFISISINDYIENLGYKMDRPNEELFRIIKEFDFEKLLIKETKKKAVIAGNQQDIKKDPDPTEIRIGAHIMDPEEEFAKSEKEESVNPGLHTFNSIPSDIVSNQDNVDEVENQAEIRDSLKISTNQLINEITMSIDHFIQENRNIKIEKILIGGEKFINIDRYIEKNSKLPVERIDISSMIPSDLFKKNSLFKTEDLSVVSSRLIISTGLALRGIK